MRTQDYMAISGNRNELVQDNHAVGTGNKQGGIQVTSDSSDVVVGNTADYIQVYYDTNSTVKGNTVTEGGLYNYYNNEVRTARLSLQRRRLADGGTCARRLTWRATAPRPRWECITTIRWFSRTTRQRRTTFIRAHPFASVRCHRCLMRSPFAAMQ